VHKMKIDEYYIIASKL